MPEEGRLLCASDGKAGLRVLDGVTTTYELVGVALASSQSLRQTVAARIGSRRMSLEELLDDKRILAPIDHPDPRCHWVTGTGFSHMRHDLQEDARRRAAGTPSQLSDAQRLIADGLVYGKPRPGKVGQQPEWFYKGDGRHLVAPGGDLVKPAFSEDGSEESEVVAHYVIGTDGCPYRVGFTLGNEFTDHAMDKDNAYYLAHAKLRKFSFGPELLLDELPPSIQGRTRIVRRNETVWEADFWSGEDHMTHSLANLEYHHFKYDLFRTPGDLHSHFLGTTTMSFSAGIRVEAGDVIELRSPAFGTPLENRVVWETAPADVRVHQL